MKRYEFKRSPIQTNLLTQYLVTNMHNTNLLGVNSKDLPEFFCLITTKFFFTTTSLSSLIWYVFMFHFTMWCKLTPSDALARFFYGGGCQRVACAQRAVGEGRWHMSLSGATSLRILLVTGGRAWQPCHSLRRADLWRSMSRRRRPGMRRWGPQTTT